MATLSIRGTSERDLQLDTGIVEVLRQKLRGPLLRGDSPGYDDARRIWNGMIDRRPKLIARCHGTSDVQHAVRFARDHRLLLSVRGGGHNIAGNALCDDGLMIDLSPMKDVQVDPARRTAEAEPGVTLGEFDARTQVHGLATPLGINSTTGLAGLTLGGGFGWLSRKYGLTVDNLLWAEVVTATGDVLRASSGENPDLFWALRGGGGNFGVVTRFGFQLHPVGPEVLAGMVIHPFDNARELLLGYRELVKNDPDELSCWVVLRRAPPLPFLPPEVHGKEVLVFAALYVGDQAAGARALRAIRELGRPCADVMGPQRYVDFQRAFDALLAPGARNYWKSNNLTQLSDGAIDAMLSQTSKLPTPQCEMFLVHLGGAASRVPVDATAYAQRDAEFVLNVHARWDDPSDDTRCIEWARESYRATRPFASGGVYINFLSGDEADRVQAAYGANHDRLRALKARYDPDNLFRMNQNIRPSARA